MPRHFTIQEILARLDRSDPSGCWPYQGCCNKGGYGTLTYNYARWLAHRFVWTQIVGPIPIGIDVLHRCDNPPCCRPDHLFLGTRADNLADMRAKGRDDPQGRKKGKTLCGENHPMAKLTADQVKAIRELLATQTLSRQKVAARFSVSKRTVQRIADGTTWRSLA